MVAMNTSVEEQGLLAYCDDSSGWPNATREKERAFRQGFLEEARRVVREWVGCDDDALDAFGELNAAHKLRRQIRERYSVYRSGAAGPKSFHLGWRPGHEVPAARARAGHHALVYVTQSWDDVSDPPSFNRFILPAWLTVVERWARQPIRPKAISPPPRPLEIEGVEPDTPNLADRDGALTAHAPDRANLPDRDGPVATPTAAPAERVASVRMSTIIPEPVRWLWPGRFALGKLSLIAGEPI